MSRAAPPLVSVLLCVYQSENSIAAAIRSVTEQTYNNWELIVIDDGSADRSVEIARAFKDDRIKVTSDGRNLGLAARLNQGVAWARGEYIARMDADDLCFPDRLARQVAYLDEHREVDLVGSSALVFGASMEALGVLPVETVHARICAQPWRGFQMPHPTWMGRATWFRRNPYDAAARKAQDQKLLYATYRHSRFACIPEPLLAYRYERLSLHKTVAGRFHFLRGIAAAGNIRHFILAALANSLAAARDIVAMMLVQDDGVIRRRLRFPTQEAVERWYALRGQLAASQEPDSIPIGN